jgi:hypothetical protein
LVFLHSILSKGPQKLLKNFSGSGTQTSEAKCKVPVDHISEFKEKSRKMGMQKYKWPTSDEDF